MLAISLGDVLQVLAIVLTASVGIWAAGKLFGRLEQAMKHVDQTVREGFKENGEDHQRIIDKMEAHGEALSSLKAKVEDHRTRYP